MSKRNILRKLFKLERAKITLQKQEKDGPETPDGFMSVQ